MIDLFERILLLKNSNIFAQVNTEDLRVVAEALNIEHYVSGDRVFDINGYGDHMYVLYSGKVGISTNPDPKVLDFVAELGPGDCFGEMNLLDEFPRSATAHVIEDAKLFSLEKEQLRGLIINYPELSLGILKSLSLRLRDTTALLQNTLLSNSNIS
jgi:CRP/FNR family cyclic AMP-dependent transcriptional regulator